MADLVWVDVVSSNIAAIGHDGKNMFVKFKNDTVYKYAGVSGSIVQEFVKSESKGKFLNANIKGKFEYEKIADVTEEKKEEKKEPEIKQGPKPKKPVMEEIKDQVEAVLKDCATNGAGLLSGSADTDMFNKKYVNRMMVIIDGVRRYEGARLLAGVTKVFMGEEDGE